jgi:predicted nucleic acid-binding protein
MSLVIDSSATLSWIYADEMNPTSRKVLDTVLSSGAWVPSIWSLEIANSLQTALRKARIDSSFRDAALADLRLMDIKIDNETHSYAWSQTLALSDKFDLTLYDACYLELAQRKSIPLASFDKELRQAAKLLGLAVI